MKNKKKKVLIALDYNPTAQKVAEGGYLLARSIDADVALLHVVSDPVYYSSMEYSPVMGFSGFPDSGSLQLTVDDLKRASQQFLEKAKRHLHDKTIETIVKGGEYADAILQTGKEIHADLIVLGTHSRSWLEEKLIGSVTEKVLHHTAIPLFIVPTKHKK
jgi:nucleotide-binding universal stress UspA family protein